MGAIASIDFEKHLFAPIDFASLPSGFDNFLLDSVKKGVEKETCTHRLKFLTTALDKGKLTMPGSVSLAERDKVWTLVQGIRQFAKVPSFFSYMQT